jgi:hypothetical protein
MAPAADVVALAAAFAFASAHGLLLLFLLQIADDQRCHRS